MLAVTPPKRRALRSPGTRAEVGERLAASPWNGRINIVSSYRYGIDFWAYAVANTDMHTIKEASLQSTPSSSPPLFPTCLAPPLSLPSFVKARVLAPACVRQLLGQADFPRSPKLLRQRRSRKKLHQNYNKQLRSADGGTKTILDRRGRRSSSGKKMQAKPHSILHTPGARDHTPAPPPPAAASSHKAMHLSPCLRSARIECKPPHSPRSGNVS